MHYSEMERIIDQKIKSTITITTDLGETFFDEDTELIVRTLTARGAVVFEQQVSWTSGMRSVAVEVNTGGLPQSIWPVSLAVSPLAVEVIAEDDLARLPDIVSLRSGGISPKASPAGSQRVERHFTHKDGTGRMLVIHEDAGDSIARHLWDGSLVLSSYLHSFFDRSTRDFPLLLPLLETSRSRDINVLELGCGCGVVGIAFAQIFTASNVLLTDLTEVEELVARNIEAAELSNDRVKFIPVDWTAPLPTRVTDQQGKIDLVIAAECIYNTDTIPALVRTMRSLVELNPDALILVSRKVRHESEAIFFDLCREHRLAQRDARSISLPGKPGYGYGDSAGAIDLYLFSAAD